MKKSLFIMSAVLLLLSLLFVSAAAAGELVGEYGYAIACSETGAAAKSGLSGEGWSWDAATKTLTLSGADIRNEAGAGIALCDGAVIVLAENTTTKIQAFYGALDGAGQLTITGTGTLEIDCPEASFELLTAGSLDITGGTVRVRSQDIGIWLWDGDLTMEGGSLSVTSPCRGIQLDSGDLALTGGELTAALAGDAGDAIALSDGAYRQSGGTVTAEGATAGIRAKAGIAVTGGSLTASASAGTGPALYTDAALQFEDCSVTLSCADAAEAAFCSSLQIQGANIQATGALAAYGAIFSESIPLLITSENVTGGTIHIDNCINQEGTSMRREWVQSDASTLWAVELHSTAFFEPSDDSPASVTVTLEPSTVRTGGSAQASALLWDSSGAQCISEEPILWSVPEGVTITGSGAILAPDAAGTYTITATVAGKTGTAELTVLEKTAIAISGVSMTGGAYKGAAYEADTSGAFSSVPLTGMTETILYRAGDTVLPSAPKAVGEYTVTVSYENGDYQGSTGSIPYSITPKTLTLDVSAESRAYNGTNLVDLQLGALSGVIPNDEVWVAASGGGQGTTADANVGTGKAVLLPAFTLTGADAANYRLAQPGGVTADITPAAWTLPVIAEQTVKTGASLAGLKAQLGDVLPINGVNGETLWGALSLYCADFAAEPKDSAVFYTVTPQEAANYDSQPQSGVFLCHVSALDTQAVAFAESALKMTYGDAPFTNPAGNSSVGGGAITYSSSDEAVAAIDPLTGQVTITGAGAAQIQATAAGVPGVWAETTASYTLTVEKAVHEEIHLSEALSSTPTATFDLSKALAGIDGAVPGEPYSAAETDDTTCSLTDGQLTVAFEPQAEEQHATLLIPVTSAHYHPFYIVLELTLAPQEPEPVSDEPAKEPEPGSAPETTAPEQTAVQPTGSAAAPAVISKTPTVRSGIARVSVSASKLSSALESGAMVSIEAVSKKSTESTEITVPRAAVSAIASEDAGLQLTTSQGTLRLDAAALARLVKTAQDSEITFAFTAFSENRFEIVAESDGDALFDLGRGEAQITAPYTLPEDAGKSDVGAYLIEPEAAGRSGEAVNPADLSERDDVTYRKKAVTFTTDLLGEFLITTETPEAAAPEAEPLLLFAPTAFLAPAPETPRFSDVPTDFWAFSAIQDLAARGVLTGMDGGLFAPSAPVTREQLVTMLASAAGVQPVDPSSAFFDVAADRWSAPYIGWAAGAGIAVGDTGGSFAPAAPVTRQEMAVMLYRFAALTGTPLPQGRPPLAFLDQAGIASWAAPAVAAMQQAGIISGVTSEAGYLFQPDAAATRAECAQMLSALLALLPPPAQAA